MAQSYYQAFRMRLWEALSETLIDLGYPDVEVWMGGQNALEPQKTFCVFEILNLTDVGRFSESYYWDEDKEEFLSHFTTFMTSLVQITVIGKDSEIVAPNLRQSFVNNRKNHDLFRSKGLSITKRSGMRPNPQKLDTEWMDCFVFDINLDFSFVDSEEYDYVEYFVINGKPVVTRPQ